MPGTARLLGESHAPRRLARRAPRVAKGEFMRHHSPLIVLFLVSTSILTQNSVSPPSSCSRYASAFGHKSVGSLSSNELNGE